MMNQRKRHISGKVSDLSNVRLKSFPVMKRDPAGLISVFSPGILKFRVIFYSLRNVNQRSRLKLERKWAMKIKVRDILKDWLYMFVSYWVYGNSIYGRVMPVHELPGIRNACFTSLLSEY